MISVIINTLNESKNLVRCLASVRHLADEIIVMDMHSDDDTAIIAKRAGAKVILHDRVNYVELTRNLSISKASHPWILLLDPDEEVPPDLVKKLKEISLENKTDFVEIPRKNIIFNKWMKASLWWPDYNVRFFKKDSVIWGDKIHCRPQTKGIKLTLPAEENMALTHYNYESISQYLERNLRYTDIQAKELVKEGYQFDWKDLITKPLSEFLARFFANRGFEDGLHGLSLGLLQSFCFLLVYLKVWEMDNFKDQNLNLKEIGKVQKQAAYELNYWMKLSGLSKNPLKRFLQKAKNKLS